MVVNAVCSLLLRSLRVVALCVVVDRLARSMMGSERSGGGDDMVGYLFAFVCVCVCVSEETRRKMRMVEEKEVQKAQSFDFFQMTSGTSDISS